ncbi:hypothetical protein [Arthrobacter sp. M4]|uniref:hypothetical protein n=1 Tax=Arthrobacter sp. M4 TaxID=218160 RepID=UPI001CDD4AD8|nr:hypothetical protein [Arthrobacter sp. M4]MCA4135691.1 hypothetical protein [Arthrobacter sp. M4]
MFDQHQRRVADIGGAYSEALFGQVVHRRGDPTVDRLGVARSSSRWLVEESDRHRSGPWKEAFVQAAYGTGSE